MSKSPKLGLTLTPQTTDIHFIDWRLAENGDGEGSNMMILDTVIGTVKERQESMDNTPVTWAMLKNGFNHTSTTPETLDTPETPNESETTNQ